MRFRTMAATRKWSGPCLDCGMFTSSTLETSITTWSIWLQVDRQPSGFVDIKMLEPGAIYYHVSRRGKIDQPHVVGRSCRVEAELSDSLAWPSRWSPRGQFWCRGPGICRTGPLGSRRRHSWQHRPCSSLKIFGNFFLADYNLNSIYLSFCFLYNLHGRVIRGVN